MYEIRVPEFGWWGENIAPPGSGRGVESALRATTYLELSPNKRLGVCLVRPGGVEEVERAWVEELAEDEGKRYWLEAGRVEEAEIRLIRDLTVSEVTKQLGVAAPTVTLWCRQGRLPGAYRQETPRGDIWRIPESALDGFEKPKRGKPRSQKD